MDKGGIVQMPMAVYTFLGSYDFTGREKLHPFCRHEGSGLSNTESDIKKSAKGAVIEARHCDTWKQRRSSERCT